MILVILGISIMILITGIVLAIKNDSYGDDAECVIAALGLLMIIGCLIAIFCLWSGVKNTTYIDDKIEVLETENAEIESELATIINEYKQFEEGVFTPIKSENSVNLIQLYPELKTNTLVEKQIQIHIDNQEQIKQLKSAQISRRMYNWWLYFG